MSATKVRNENNSNQSNVEQIDNQQHNKSLSIDADNYWNKYKILRLYVKMQKGETLSNKETKKKNEILRENRKIPMIDNIDKFDKMLELFEYDPLRNNEVNNISEMSEDQRIRSYLCAHKRKEMCDKDQTYSQIFFQLSLG